MHIPRKQFGKRNLTKKTIGQFSRLDGLNDLLSYLILLEDNIILHKDGALSAHFAYQGPDLTVSSDEELNAHSNTWAHALSFLGDGWMVETNVISLPFEYEASSQAFPELLSAVIDDERRLQYNDGTHFVSHYYLSITFKPEQLIAKEMAKLSSNKNDALQFDKQLSQFKQQVDEVTGYLARSIEVNALNGSELMTYLHQCLTGTVERLAEPSMGTFLDSYLSKEAFTGGVAPKIGDKHIKTIAINDLPQYSFPSLLASLNTLPCSYRWSSRFICLDSATAQDYLKAHQRYWSSKAIGIMGVIRDSLGLPTQLDEDANQQAQHVIDAQRQNSAGETRYGFYNSTLVLMDKNKQHMNELATDIVNHIQRLDFKVRMETINACESYLGTLPCHGNYNLRKLLVSNIFVSHALPLSQGYQGETHAPCPYYGKNKPPLFVTSSTGNRPFLFNCHVGDVGHTAILGPTGSGKSTLIAALMLGHRKYKDSRLIVLDKDLSHRRIIDALGGHYIQFDKGKTSLSPLGHVKGDNTSSIERAYQWLSDCCELQGVSMTPARQTSLRQSIEQLASEPQAYKTLNHLCVQESTLRDAISSLNTGQFAKMMNGTAPMRGGNVIGFDMGTLIANSQSSQSIAMLHALFNELFDCFQDKRPTLLILEEAWMLLKHPLIKDKLDDWFKTLRKFNVAVIFVSQELSDMVSKDSHAIQNACMTRLYLPNPTATEEICSTDYRAFGLNDKQIQLIANAQPKRDYYYTSPKGQCLFQLNLGELASSILCESSQAKLNLLDEHITSNPKNWLHDWVKTSNLGDWDDYLSHNYTKRKII